MTPTAHVELVLIFGLLAHYIRIVKNIVYSSEFVASDSIIFMVEC